MTVERDESGQAKPTALLGGVVFTGIDDGNHLIILKSDYDIYSIVLEDHGAIQRFIIGGSMSLHHPINFASSSPET